MNLDHTTTTESTTTDQLPAGWIACESCGDIHEADLYTRTPVATPAPAPETPAQRAARQDAWAAEQAAMFNWRLRKALGLPTE